MKSKDLKRRFFLVIIIQLFFTVTLLAQRPNIIIIKTDDQCWNSLSCYGDPIIKTPNIDALAEEGTMYTNAYTAAVLCTPSRTCFFSGKYASTTKRFYNKTQNYINVNHFSFIEPIKNNGYKIGIAGKNHAFHNDYYKKWFDFVEEYSSWGKIKGTLTESDKKVREFRQTSGPPSRLGNSLLEGLIDFPEPFKEEECMTSRIADDAITFIEQNKNNPFFLHVSYLAPHFPNVVCEPYFSMYMDQLKDFELTGMDAIDWDRHPFAHYVQSQASGFDTTSIENRRKILAIMYGQITFVDKSIGRIVEALKKQNLYQNTLIVFTSDQGSFKGLFGLCSKTKGFYDALTRIPLIIKKPGDKELKRVSEAQISNIDVMPTILEYAGIKYNEQIDGKSFIQVMNGKSNEHRSAIFAEVGFPELPPKPMQKNEYDEYNKKRSAEDMFWFIEYTTRGRCASIKKDGWKYCYYNGDLEELYHVAADPNEINNLASFPEYSKRKKSLQKELFKMGFVGIPY